MADPNTVFLDGAFLPRSDARVSAFDAGFQHAVGLFETMLAVPGPDGSGGPEIVRLEWHTERLRQSAMELGLADSLETRALGEAAVETVRQSGLCDHGSHARVRLSVTGGDLNLLQSQGQSQHRPTVLIQAQPATTYPDEMFEKGVRVAIAQSRANPFNPTEGHKTPNYWWRLRELQAAAAVGAAEALVFQISNHLAGGCVSNCFVVKDGTVITPIARGEEVEVARAAGDTNAEPKAVLPSPVLPGVTRRWVLECCEDEKVPVERRMVTIDDVLDADEVFLTNSSWGVLPVVGVGESQIGGGKAGERAWSIREAWLSSLEP
ncbi:MAG: aminotransferase class IV [Planctomycetota bacterium]